MIHLNIHLLPQEIDQLEQTLIQLKKCGQYVDGDEFLVEVILNTNLTDWESSSLDIEFFENKLSYLEKLTSSWAKTKFWVSKNGEVLGCMDSRRQAIRTSDADSFIWLDCDLVFQPTLLYSLYESYKVVKANKEKFIITPQITRCWDNTWDVITNEKYMNVEASHENYFNRDPYILNNPGDPSLREIDTFKFAGGWFTLISKALLEETDLPDALGCYGPDDTYVMHCCILGNQKGFDATQFIITNEIVIENNKFRYNPYTNYVTTIDRKDEFRKQSEVGFNPSINNFLNKF